MQFWQSPQIRYLKVNPPTHPKERRDSKDGKPASQCPFSLVPKPLAYRDQASRGAPAERNGDVNIVIGPPGSMNGKNEDFKSQPKQGQRHPARFLELL